MAQKDYLKQGEQTKLTDLVYEHVDKIRTDIKKNLRGSLIHQTCQYIYKLDKIKGYTPNPETSKEREYNMRLKKSIFRQRDLHQILKEGYFPTCSDIGILFRGLMIAQGVPTSYLETFHEDYVLDKQSREANIMGHVLGKVYLGDSSIIINPTFSPTHYKNETHLFWNKKYIPFKEGLDSWDIGIHSLNDVGKLKNENLINLLNGYKSLLTKNYQTKMERVEELKNSDKLKKKA